jgi:alkylhydroperoxidase family enzyme
MLRRFTIDHNHKNGEEPMKSAVWTTSLAAAAAGGWFAATMFAQPATCKEPLTATQKISDETYARAKKVFNDQQIVDLTAVAGNYVMVAMLLAMAEETVPPGKEPPFKVGEW